jgi:hypothetical protein
MHCILMNTRNRKTSHEKIAFCSILIVATSLALLILFPFMTSTTHDALASTSGVNATGGPAQKVSQQGLVTSSTDPLPGHETHQSAVILRLRGDNALYDGTLTFTASKPVEVQVLHRSLNSSVPTIPTEFGAINVLPLPGNAGSVTISNIVPEFQEGGFVATLPFSGNAISLHNIDGEPFVASYSVAADLETGVQRADDISAVETSTEQQTIAEEDEPAEEEDSQDDASDNDGDTNDDEDGSDENGGDDNNGDENGGEASQAGDTAGGDTAGGG